ncbi:MULTISPECIES: hypothetical protein [Aerosakkonema]|uniref:hypothetical protein n=1 Tax=Aerosakkonema TaxID=1246629 RepID=UPI0035BAD03B
MYSDFLGRFDREFALDEKLGEDYVEGLVVQGYSDEQIVRQAEALRNGTPLDELPLDMDAEDYYDYLSGGFDSLEDDGDIEPELVEYVYLDPNAPDDF